MLAPKPGQPLPKEEKWADETVVYSIDLSSQLENNEVATKVLSITTDASTTKVRTRKGKFIELTVLPWIFDTTAPSVDQKVTILYETTSGNARSVSFMLKVHR